jgi:dienelactone hydrolase
VSFGLKSGAEIAARAALLPGLLGLRWLTRRPRPGSLYSRPSLASALLHGKVALDEIFFATEVIAGAPLAFFDAKRINREADEAIHLYRSRGWLDDPTAFHVTPPPLGSVDIDRREQSGVEFLHLRFESGYLPQEGDPARSRWCDYEPNHTAHAWIYRHPGEPRPWIVCLPGYRMGHPMVDAFAFDVLRLHHDFGLNVAVPVFPFHGPRAVGRRGGDGFLSGDFLDTVHGQAQAVWDARRLIRWLRQEGAPAVGIYGLSLGAYTATLLASLDHDHDCVIVGIPAIDFPGLLYSNTSSMLIQATELFGYPWTKIKTLLRVVSPLALSLRVPRARCHLFAGAADALAPQDQVHDLWDHWGQPSLSWYNGGHVSFVMERRVREIISEALARTGLISEEPAYQAI